MKAHYQIILERRKQITDIIMPRNLAIVFHDIPSQLKTPLSHTYILITNSYLEEDQINSLQTFYDVILCVPQKRAPTNGVSSYKSYVVLKKVHKVKGAQSYFSKFSFLFHLKNHYSN